MIRFPIIPRAPTSAWWNYLLFSVEVRTCFEVGIGRFNFLAVFVRSSPRVSRVWAFAAGCVVFALRST